MQILLNGKTHEIKDKMTLYDLVQELSFDKGSFAIAINAEVIPQGRYLYTWLQANDQIEIVTAFYGG